MQITCAIIDDEPLACELLKQYVEKISFLKLNGIYNTASQAVRNITGDPVDLVFMDIQMPDVNGIELTRMLPIQTKVVFTSAFREYAIDGFRVSALDYLLKPINFNEFLQAANKGLTAKEIEQVQPETQPVMMHDQISSDFIFVKDEQRTVRIDFSDLVYIEGKKDYVCFHTLSQANNPAHSAISMKSVQQHLPSSQFIRVHRSFIVNTSHINCIERNEIIINQQRIPISEGYRPELMQFIKQHCI